MCTNEEKYRVKSVSETLITMTFPTYILFLGKDTSKLDGQRDVISGGIWIAMISSILGVMSWLCVSDILWRVSQLWCKASRWLIYLSSGCVMVLSCIFLFLFKNSNTAMVILMLFLVSLVAGIGCLGEHFRQTNPPSNIEHSQDLSNGLAILFFFGLAGRVIAHFTSTTEQMYATKENSVTEEQQFDISLWFLYVGSLWVVFSMVLNVLTPGNCHPDVETPKFLDYSLVLLVTGAVLTSISKSLIYFFICGAFVFYLVLVLLLSKMFHDKDKNNDNAQPNQPAQPNQEEEKHKPFSLAITNLSFTSLFTVLAYNGKHSQGLLHNTFAFLMSCTLISSLILRVLTHDMPPQAQCVAKVVGKIHALFTLLLVILAVIASAVLAFLSI